MNRGSRAYVFLDAAMRNDLTGVQRALDAGADVHTEGDFALRMSASRGCLPVVECLLASGAAVQARNDEALTRASENRHAYVVMRLIRAEANVQRVLQRLDGVGDRDSARWLQHLHKQWQADRVGRALDVLPHACVSRRPDAGLGL